MFCCIDIYHRLCCTCCRMGTTGSARSLPSLPGMASSTGRGPAMQSLLLLGRPGSGKTTLLRDIVAQLDQRFGLNVLVVDTSNEIAGGSWPCSTRCYVQVMLHMSCHCCSKYCGAHCTWCRSAGQTCSGRSWGVECRRRSAGPWSPACALPALLLLLLLLLPAQLL